MVFDKHRGPLVFVRIYSGSKALLLFPERWAALTSTVVFSQTMPIILFQLSSFSPRTALTAGTHIYNTTSRSRERAVKLLRVHANHYEEMSEVPAGHICAVVGLKVGSAVMAIQS